MKQKELAEALGVTVSMVSQYESGKRVPKLATLRKIAKALDVDWINLAPVDQHPGLIIDHMIKLARVDDDSNEVDDDNNEVDDQQQKQQLYELYDMGESLGEKGILEEMDDNGLGLRSDYACSMVRAFNLLNEQGQKAAAERVQELLEIARYRSWVNDDCFWAEDILKDLPSAPVRPAEFDVNDDPDAPNH
jgi:transcriptional regulator with XRE-family HTH domain